MKNGKSYCDHYIPTQAYEMLLRPWNYLSHFPYFAPDQFGSSVLISSPFLFLIFKEGGINPQVKLLSWIAILAILLTIWMHGNAGGLQFSYRYATSILPFCYLLILEAYNGKSMRWGIALILYSMTANAFAVYLVHWTDFVTDF